MYKMSSVVRSFAQTHIPDVKFVSLITPFYSSPANDDNNVALPFTMSRQGELELVETPDYLAYYADLSGSESNYPQPGGNSDLSSWIYVMGGKRVVLRIGTNLKRYVAQWLEEKKGVRADYASRVTLHTQGCVVSKIQQYFFPAIEYTGTARASYVSTVEPAQYDNFVTNQLYNYGTTYLFKSPLVMKYVKENGSVVYATFKSSIDED
jgi:hypothetical protein